MTNTVAKLASNNNLMVTFAPEDLTLILTASAKGVVGVQPITATAQDKAIELIGISLVQIAQLKSYPKFYDIFEAVEKGEDVHEAILADIKAQPPFVMEVGTTTSRQDTSVLHGILWTLDRDGSPEAVSLANTLREVAGELASDERAFGAPMSSLENQLSKAADSITHCGDCGNLFFNPKTKAVHWVAGDADFEDPCTSYDDVKAAFTIEGVTHVEIGDEWAPNEQDEDTDADWVEIPHNAKVAEW